MILIYGFHYLVQVIALLEVLPNRLTADVLEELRISKQTLVCFLQFDLQFTSFVGKGNHVVYFSSTRLNWIRGRGLSNKCFSTSLRTLMKYVVYALWEEAARLREGVMMSNALSLWKNKLLRVRLVIVVFYYK